MIKQRDAYTHFPVTISRFRAGLATNRDPLHTPLRVQALTVIPLYDALIDGLNVEISPRETLVRRPGFPQFCSVAITGTPLAFSSFKRTGSTPYLILDTTTGVYQFTTSAVNPVYTKSTTAQTAFQQAGAYLYCADGTSAKKVDSSLNVTNWGIVAPTVTPNVANVAAPSLSAWAANTFYSTSRVLVDSNSNLQLLTTAGTTGAAQPSPWATTPGATTTDNTAVWTCQGPAARQTSHVYAASSVIAVTYTKTYTYSYTYNGHVIQGTATVTYNDFFNTTLGGTSSGTATASLSWASGVGSQVTDGSVTWSNIGSQITWTTIGANTLVSTDSFIVDSNGFQQLVSKTGKSGGSAPSFSQVLNQVTNDNGTAWTNNGSLISANTLPWSYVFVFKNSTTAHISSASSVSSDIFLAANSYISVTGPGSSDAQVDKIDIYRTKQGGSIYYYLDEVSNPGGSATWTYTDTKNDANLNTELIVTTVPLNTPPPTGASLIAFYQGRLWVASGRNLYFDGGGDIINGVAHECFPPANVFPYLTDIKALVPTSEGLLVFLEDEIHVILGGPQTLTYFSQTVMQGVGVKSQNAVQQDHDNVYLLSSQGQAFLLSSDGFGEFGLSIADTLGSTFSPATSYLARHRNGQDVGLFISDGSANMIRYNPTTEAWSSVAQPVGGCGPIASLETSSAVFSLLTTIGGHICARSLTNFVDGSSTYTAYGTIGSIEVGPLAAETAEVNHIIARLKNVGSRPAISVLANSTSGTFASVPFQTTVPAQLRGTPLESTSVLQNRHDLSGSTGVAYNQINHLQVKVSWPSENAANELTALVIR